MKSAAEGLSAPDKPVVTPTGAGTLRRIQMSNRWNQREKHVGNGNSAVPPVRHCRRPMSRAPKPVGEPPSPVASSGPVEPWLAMDEDFFVRRVSGHFSRLARRPAEECVGQSLFAVLASFGVGSRTLDEVFDRAIGGQTCFVDLPKGALGRRHEQYSLEIRPIPTQAGWVIRFVAIAWRTDRASPSAKAPSSPTASPLEIPDFNSSPSRNERPAPGRFRRPGGG